jgi:hypothetical protein
MPKGHFGGVAEWSKAAVLKTVVPQGTVGSNPTPSAKNIFSIRDSFEHHARKGNESICWLDELNIDACPPLEGH